MFKKKSAAALLCATMLLAGCGSTGASAAVDMTCTQDMSGMTMIVKISAPGEDKEISSMSIEAKAEYETMLGGQSLEGLDVKELISSMEGPLKTQLATEMKVPEETITLEAGDTEMLIKVAIDDPKQFFTDSLGMEPKGDELTFKTAKEELSQSFTCE